ncbi:MAG: class I SAM-dependent methyltransferase [Planctomycetes bacterium]|nr:class I SAM-dependent methyltransferase [Planctomycetota bacterium]
MNQILRHLALAAELPVYGPSYALLQHLIRTPTPLDPEPTWQLVTRPLPAPLYWLWNHYPPALVRSLLLWWKLRQPHNVGIEEHYDVSNAFYELFLDKKFMFYTCADFVTGRETIEEAQTKKADFFLNLIQPKAGEKILDLGCGWGGMMRLIAETTGDRDGIVGYTLSKNQYAHVRERLGLNVELKNFITCAYEPLAYDKIYSIGSWEAVRPADLDMLVRKLHGALRPGGRMVHHFFTHPGDAAPAMALPGQIFFPGSLPPGHTGFVRAFENAGFRIVHRSLHDYRPTLRAWFDNLAANRDRALELVGAYTYNRCLVFFPGAWMYFQDGNATLIRYVLEKV